MYIDTESCNNTKEKTMAGYPQQHGQLLPAFERRLFLNQTEDSFAFLAIVHRSFLYF